MKLIRNATTDPDTDLLLDHTKADKKNKNSVVFNVYVVFIYNLIKRWGWMISLLHLFQSHLFFEMLFI